MNAVAEHTGTYNTPANRRALSNMDTLEPVCIGPALVKFYASRTTRRFTVFVGKRNKSFSYPRHSPTHIADCQRAITGVLTWIDAQQGGG